MSADKYFTYAAELLKLHPPHITDEPIVARMRRIGIEVVGASTSANSIPLCKRRWQRAGGCASTDEMESAYACQGRELLVDEHRHDGCLRQLLSQTRHGHTDRSRCEPARGRDLSSQSRRRDWPVAYRREQVLLHFDKSQLPPASGFWSVTLYDSEGFQVANSINRFAVSSWMPFKYNADGSLDLYFQNESPGTGKEANWLPAPKGAFNLTMRLYAPKKMR